MRRCGLADDKMRRYLLLLFLVVGAQASQGGTGVTEARIRDVVDSVIKELLPRIIRSMGEGPPITPECFGAIIKTITGVRELQAWAFQLLDASGKIPAGLFEGTTTSLGSYDQCLDLALPRGDRGQYCTLLVRPFATMTSANETTTPATTSGQSPETQTILDVLSSIGGELSGAELRFGLCTPALCSAQDLENMASQAASALGVESRVLRCETKQPLTLDTPSKVVLILMSFVIGLVVTGTLCDYLSRDYLSRDKKSGIHSCLRLLGSFSVLTNTASFLRTDQDPRDVKQGLCCLPGIRFLSAAWNVMGNVFFLPSVVEFANFRSRIMVPTNERHLFHSAFSNSTLSYEAFFFVSGLLATARVLRKGTSLKQVFRNVFQDFLVWTLISTSLTLLVIFFSQLGAGPFYGDIVSFGRRACVSNWWGNLLHISNFWHPSQICIIHNWILSGALQVQLFCLPLLILPILWGRSVLAVTSGVLLTSGSLLTTGLLTWSLDLAPAMDGVTTDYLGRASELIGMVLIRPYTHLGVYVVGVFAALVAYMWRDARIPRLIRWLGWLCCLVCFFGTVYGLHNHRNGTPLSRSVRALYASLHRPVFSLVLAWVYFICASGHARLLRSFLSWPVFGCLDRLSPIVFCLNPVVIFGTISSLRERQFYGYQAMVHQFLSIFCLTYILSFLLYLCVEAPVTALLTWVWPASKTQVIKEEDMVHIPSIASTAFAQTGSLKNGHKS